jgi:Kef-type K+ transport system membrane component KefB
VPTLARIIQERGLTGTRAGTLALAAGAIGDAAAWCILAVMLSRMNENWTGAALANGGGAAYVLATFFGGRRVLARFLRSGPDGGISPSTLAVVLSLLMIAAWYTDFVGIHAVFGAFVLGVAMPRNGVAHRLAEKIEPLTVGLLLPLFFVYSGLNTRIGLLSTPGVMLFAAGVLVAACAGKGLACWGAARLNGETPTDSTLIGALMNARGLMELIILNIGLERGVITPKLFTVMVLMALVTTFAATPIVDLVRRRRATTAGRESPPNGKAQPAVTWSPAQEVQV